MFKPQFIAPAELDYHRSLLLPSGKVKNLSLCLPWIRGLTNLLCLIGSNLVYRSLLSSRDEVNSAIVIHYQICSSNDFALRAQLSLFNQITYKAMFNVLRTQEQLGYVVSTSIQEFKGVQGFRVLIQSEKGPEFLEERIKKFWMGSESYLKEMSEEEFKHYKDSKRIDLLQKPKNLDEE